jgi:hypothetical protein
VLHLRTINQTTEPRSQNVIYIGCQAETVVGLSLGCSCPWVGKVRTVLPLSDVIRDSAVQLVLTHQLKGKANPPGKPDFLYVTGAQAMASQTTELNKRSGAIRASTTSVFGKPCPCQRLAKTTRKNATPLP